MEFGISLIAGSRTIRADELAREVEARGFESIWFADHSYIPCRPQPGHKAHGEGNTKEQFRYIYDQFINMAAAALSTTKLLVGSGVCVLTERDPLRTAKAIASLDALSNGRILFGVGAGWHPEEMLNHGTVFKERYKIVRERILAIQALWGDDVAEFHGDHVNFDPVWAEPSCLQKPRVPCIAGFEGPNAIKSMIEWSDGWCPSAAYKPRLEEGIKIVHGYLEEAGRDTSSYHVSIQYGASWLPGSEIIGQEDIENFERIGVKRVLLGVPPAGRDVVLPLLDRFVADLKL